MLFGLYEYCLLIKESDLLIYLSISLSTFRWGGGDGVQGGKWKGVPNQLDQNKVNIYQIIYLS